MARGRATVETATPHQVRAHVRVVRRRRSLKEVMGMIELLDMQFAMLSQQMAQARETLARIKGSQQEGGEG